MRRGRAGGTGGARRGRSAATLAALAALGAGASAAPAAATVPWGTAGGDAGRAGFEALGGGSAPYEPLWAAVGGESRDVVTSLLITAGGAGGLPPRVVYGTADGRLHLRDLYTGAAVGDPAGVAVGPLTGFDGSVTPADSSTTAAGMGQLFAVTTEAVGPGADPGAPRAVVIAQVDELTGRPVGSVRLPRTEGLVVSSSPLLSDPAPDGSRSLVFTATDRADWAAPAGAGGVSRVLRVPIRDAHGPRARIAAAETEIVDVPALNPLAAPALFRGVPSAVVTLATGDPARPLRTLVADDFGEAVPDVPALFRPRFGPSAGRLDAAASEGDRVFAQTPAIPRPPGGGADALLLATSSASREQTVLHRLTPDRDGLALVESARSAPLPGRAGPQPATSERGDDRGTVVVGTSRNLYGLDGRDLSRRWVLQRDPGLPAGSGFARSAPLISGGTVFATRDDGRRIAVALRDGVPLGEDRFDTTTGVLRPTAARGGAAAAGGVVVLASDEGVVALRGRCGNVLEAERGIGFVGTEAGDRATGGPGADAGTGHGGGDCLGGGGGADRLRGGAGDDVLDGGPGGDVLLGGDGSDALRGGPGEDRLSGAAGADALSGGSGEDTLRGGEGVDALDGGPGADTLAGDAGIDALVGGPGADTLRGGSGDDRLEGGPGADVLSGGSGRDTLLGGPGGGRLLGGGGDDRIDAANGVRDTVDCGPGLDRVLADRADTLRGCERISRPAGQRRPAAPR